MAGKRWCWQVGRYLCSSTCDSTIEMSLCPNFKPFDLKVFFPTIAMFRSVPVTAELQGLATIGGKTGELKMTIDYTSFVEVYIPLSCFQR